MNLDRGTGLRGWITGLLGSSINHKPAAEKDPPTATKAVPPVNPVQPKQEPKVELFPATSKERQIKITNIDPVQPSQPLTSRSFLTSQISTKRPTLQQRPDLSNKVPPKCLKLEGSEREFALNADSMFVGKEPMNDICLPEDGSVQATHALITHESGQYWIVNKANAHKIKLNDNTIKLKTAFRSGDELRIGNQVLKAE